MKKNSYPERTCIVCRKKDEKKNLFKLVKQDGKDVFDSRQRLEGRSRYICRDKNCLIKVSKNRKLNFSSEILYELSKELVEKKTDAKSVLNFLKRSSKLCFGYDMTKEALLKNKVSLLIIAKDMNLKNRENIEKIAKEMKVRTIEYGLSSELAKIFSKEKVGVIGITDKKAAIGFAKKLGGEQSDT